MKSPKYLIIFLITAHVFDALCVSFLKKQIFEIGSLEQTQINLFLSLVPFLSYIPVAIWIYLDSKKRQSCSLCWMIFVLIAQLYGLIIYLLFSLRKDNSSGL